MPLPEGGDRGGIYDSAAGKRLDSNRIILYLCNCVAVRCKLGHGDEAGDRGLGQFRQIQGQG